MTDQELDRLLSQAAPMARDLWLSSLPGDGELPQARPSPAFQRRMDRLIRRMGRSPRRVRALAQVRRAAAVALVFLAVGFSGLRVTSQAFRAQVLEVLVQVYEEITNFRFSAEGETDRTAGDFVLTYLPQGMEETVRQSSRIRHYICFEDNAGNMLEVTHIVVGANASSILGVDTEDAEVEYFKIHNSEAMAISKNLDHTIFWTEDNCYYLLSGTIPMEELKQVALGLEPIS